MDKAVDGMHDERAFIFGCFGVGLITTLMALMSAAWILMTLEVAMVATLGISWALFIIVRQARRISTKFGLSQDELVSFKDIMQSPAVPVEYAGDDVESSETSGLLDSNSSYPGHDQEARRGRYDL
jgi:hypothetical protein